MKCEIIRDLLPSYIEGLTSEESNQSIEDHLKTCPKCKKYFEEMQASITAPEIDAASKAEIQPFKKLKKKTRYKVRIRAVYTKSGYQTATSKWSAIKTVKTKY